jgi:CheY-like chemotaxis protein
MTKDETSKSNLDPVQKEQIHPRLHQLQNNLSAIKSHVTERTSSGSSEPLHILVVDSNREFLASVKSFLLLQHIEVMTVVDGLTALTLFHNHRFDAIVTGASISRLGGDIIAQYVKNSHLPIPIIAIVYSQKMTRIILMLL